MERLQWMQPVLAGIFQILSHTHRSQVRKVQKLGIRDPIETTPFGRNQRESSWDWMCLNRSIDFVHIEKEQEIPRDLSKSNPIVHGRTRNHRSSFHLHKSNPDFRDRPMDRNRQSKTQTILPASNWEKYPLPLTRESHLPPLLGECIEPRKSFDRWPLWNLKLAPGYLNSDPCQSPKPKKFEVCHLTPL